MKISLSFCISILFVLAGCGHARADVISATAYQMEVAEIAILPIMMMLTYAGGGYAILSRMRRGVFLRKMAIPAWFTMMWVSLTIFSKVDDGIVLFLTVIFGVFAFMRGVKMISWGVSGPEKLLVSANECNAKRLIPAGVLLVLSTFFLMGMAGAFYGRAVVENSDQSGEVKEQRLVEYSAYQMAVSKLEAPAGKKLLLRKELPFPAGGRPQGAFAGYKIETLFESDGETFTIYATPESFPVFPYSLLAKKPAYRADQTGSIRKRIVMKPATCPPDAPEIRRVSQADITAANEKYGAILENPEFLE